MEACFNNLKKNSPLIHCISNYVTANDLANIILALGASPIMADDINEVEEVVGISDGLVVNMGSLNEKALRSMIRAGKRANQLNIPVVFDPVGVGISEFRREASKTILSQLDISVITGNLSEIEYLLTGIHMDRGVDSARDISSYDEGELKRLVEGMAGLSKKYSCLVEVTGEMDILVEGDRLAIYSFGDGMMEEITGTGCMLTAMIAAYVAGNRDNIFEAALMASRHMSVAGYFAGSKVRSEKLGTGSFKVFLLDYVNRLEKEEIIQLGELRYEI